jgi:hypothetical protein
MPGRRLGGGLGGQGFGYGGRYNIVEARREMFAARQGLVSDCEMGREMEYQNQRYHDQQFGGYGGLGRGTGVGPFVLVDGVKRILRHVS